MELVQNELLVDRAMFREALRLAKRVGGVGSQPAVLTYHDGQLKIELGGCEFSCDAKGVWDGQAKVPSGFLKQLYNCVPKSDEPVLVTTDGRSLQIGQLNVDCEWTALVYPRITLPLGPCLRDYLTLPLKYSKTDIERSDLAGPLQDAVAKKEKIIEKAALVLRPLGIDESHLDRLLVDLLKQQVEHEKGGVT